jgi:hypothetical protein
VLNVSNLIEWSFDLLILAQSGQSERFVNPRMATLTRGSLEVEKTPWQGTRDSRGLPAFYDGCGSAEELKERIH